MPNGRHVSALLREKTLVSSPCLLSLNMPVSELAKNPLAVEEIHAEETASFSKEVPGEKNVVEAELLESPDEVSKTAAQKASDSEIPDGGSKAWMAVAGACVRLAQGSLAGHCLSALLIQ